MSMVCGRLVIECFAGVLAILSFVSNEVSQRYTCRPRWAYVPSAHKVLGEGSPADSPDDEKVCMMDSGKQTGFSAAIGRPCLIRVLGLVVRDESRILLRNDSRSSGSQRYEKPQSLQLLPLSSAELYE